MGYDLVNMVSVPTFRRNLLSETLRWTLEPREKSLNWSVRVFLQVHRIPFVSYCSLPFFVRSHGSSASVVITTAGSSSPSVVDINCPPWPRYWRLCDLTTNPEGVGAKLRGLAAVPPLPPYVCTTWCFTMHRGSLLLCMRMWVQNANLAAPCRSAKCFVCSNRQ